MTFTKLFSSITESTVWCEPHPVRIVWITMLAMCNKHGFVFGSIPGLANRARVTIEETEEALRRFQRPDPYSRTKDFEGRRIEEIDGGWRLLTYDKHRAISDEEDRRTYMRNLMRRKRAAAKNVSNVSKSEQPLAEAEAEAEVIHNTHTGGEIPYSSEKISSLPKYTQNDHDEKHLRLIAAAEKKISQSLQASIGRDATITEQQFVVMVCQEVGITVERYFELKEKQKKWPYQITPVL